ncbi:hypothetical protein EXS70_05220 [Candidatus Peribacteria bacterium]|nr:hypothetical protein [Candidatus Peribacteria bacterium]
MGKKKHASPKHKHVRKHAHGHPLSNAKSTIIALALLATIATAGGSGQNSAALTWGCKVWWAPWTCAKQEDASSFVPKAEEHSAASVSSSSPESVKQDCTAYRTSNGMFGIMQDNTDFIVHQKTIYDQDGNPSVVGDRLALMGSCPDDIDVTVGKNVITVGRGSRVLSNGLYFERKADEEGMEVVLITPSAGGVMNSESAVRLTIGKIDLMVKSGDDVHRFQYPVAEQRSSSPEGIVTYVPPVAAPVEQPAYVPSLEQEQTSSPTYDNVDVPPVEPPPVKYPQEPAEITDNVGDPIATAVEVGEESEQVFAPSEDEYCKKLLQSGGPQLPWVVCIPNANPFNPDRSGAPGLTVIDQSTSPSEDGNANGGGGGTVGVDATAEGSTGGDANQIPTVGSNDPYTDWFKDWMTTTTVTQEPTPPTTDSALNLGSEGVVIMIPNTADYRELSTYTYAMWVQTGSDQVELPNGEIVSFQEGTLSDNDWHHVAVTRDNEAGQMGLYLDGTPRSVIPVRSASRPNSLWGSLFAMAFPAARQDLSIRGDIVVDEIRLYNRALDKDEVYALYMRSLLAPTDGLLARWSMNDGQGSMVTDTSGNDHNGVVTGQGFMWTSVVGGMDMHTSAPNDAITKFTTVSTSSTSSLSNPFSGSSASSTASLSNPFSGTSVSSTSSLSNPFSGSSASSTASLSNPFSGTSVSSAYSLPNVFGI